VKKNNRRAEDRSPSTENLTASAVISNANNGPPIVHTRFANPCHAGISEKTASISANIPDNNPLFLPLTSPFDHILYPADSYSSRHNQLIAMKCGSCQKNNNPKRNHACHPNPPPAPTHPIIGGIAPGIAPTSVFVELKRFSGV